MASTGGVHPLESIPSSSLNAVFRLRNGNDGLPSEKGFIGRQVGEIRT